MTIRLVQAKEALRQAELRLAAQATALAAIEARAGALIAWSMAGVVAGGAGLFLPTVPPAAAFASAGLAASLVAAAVAGVLALLPGDWGVAGHKPKDVMGEWVTDEEDLFDWLAEGYNDTIAANAARLERASRALRWALRFLIVSPGIALLVGAAGAMLRA